VQKNIQEFKKVKGRSKCGLRNAYRTLTNLKHTLPVTAVVKAAEKMIEQDSELRQANIQQEC